jgi:GntR family transcriptional regulator
VTPRTTISRASRRLLVDDVRDGLLAAIQARELPVGERIPTEPELCEQFGVSRVTVREAVRSLVESGFLHRVQGSGTYVAFRPSVRHTLERNLSYSAMIEEAGLAFRLRMLSLERGEPSDVEAATLGLGADQQVARVHRVRCADDRPVVLSVDAIPGHLVEHVPDEGFEGSLYRLLESQGSNVAHGEATLRPVLAESQQAQHLDIEVGSPLLQIRQLDWTETGKPAMFSLEWHVPGMFELTILRRAG